MKSSALLIRNSALAVAAMAMGLSGCSFKARDAEAYRQATRDALMTQNDKVEGCYNQALAADASVSGDVVVRFAVEKKTGKLINPALDESATTAPAQLSQCVLASLDGVALPEPDRREGQATFTWSFAAKTAVTADAAPAGESPVAPLPPAPAAPAAAPAPATPAAPAQPQ